MPHHYRVVFLAGEDGGDGMMIDELMREISAIFGRSLSIVLYIPKVRGYIFNSMDRFVMISPQTVRAAMILPQDACLNNLTKSGS